MKTDALKNTEGKTGVDPGHDGSIVLDRELEQYRNLLKPPTEFRDGFGWSTVVGVLFCGLIMMPGSIYLGLMSGGSMGAAATWVTVILFMEIMRRSLKSPTQQELVVLLYAAGAMATGGVFMSLVQRAYIVGSTPIRDAGLRDAFPAWWAPKAESMAIVGRNLMHSEWMMPIALLAAMSVIGFVSKWCMGYFFFRLTSDVEKLPFPMAPISAQGSLAMAESDQKTEDSGAETQSLLSGKTSTKKKSNRWRLFTLGVSLGVFFGFIQVGFPAITGLFLEKPIFLIPQPWIDTTTVTQSFLPATPTGMVLDLGIVLMGMVIPFWAVIGTIIAIVGTIILNPILYHCGVLSHWQPGMDTINSSFSNGLDFWISFGIGTGFGIAAVGIFQTIRDVRKKLKDISRKNKEESGTVRENIWATPKGRGDFPMWIAVAGYFLASSCTVVLCYCLLPQNLTLLCFLIFFAFIYNPFISYVNSRLMGISGQSVDIPFVRETAFILSGSKGIGIWLAPIPIENQSGMVQNLRVGELTGVSFRSLIKIDLVVIPVSFLLSALFWGFIWSSDSIPSSSFPAAQVQWELYAKNCALLWSSTYTAPGQVEHSLMDSQFMQAIHPGTIGIGFGWTVCIFTILSFFGLPTMLVYGMIRGLGGMPHTMLLELLGALLGRYYYQKKFGADDFLRMIPTIIAGYFTGVGLIAMATIAMRFIQSAISSAPF